MKVLQHALLWAGFALVGWFALDSGARAQQARAAVESFGDAALPPLHEVALPVPDTSLWSDERIDAFDRAEADVVGVLRIEQLGLEAPVVAGTGDTHLDAGVGWMRGSARPGGDGHVVMAAHRDGFFRALKDLKEHATVEIETARGRHLYAVRSMRVVEPDDVSVLRPLDEPLLTLITCYPFYFVGPAPQRFVVRAERLPARADGP